jgi:hypothetical protein
MVDAEYLAAVKAVASLVACLIALFFLVVVLIVLFQAGAETCRVPAAAIATTTVKIL